MTVSAAASKKEKTQDWQIVIERDHRLAMGATRAGSDHGFPQWNSVDTDIQEAADKSTQNACDEIDDRHLFLLMGPNFLN